MLMGTNRTLLSKSEGDFSDLKAFAYAQHLAFLFAIDLIHIHFLFQLFKRRNVELINEDAAMSDSPHVDSFVSSTTGGVSILRSCVIFPSNGIYCALAYTTIILLVQK